MGNHENFILCGEKKFKENVSRLLKENKFPNSVIITGEKGIGKKTAAAYIAASLLCEDIKDGMPCGSCPSCRMVKKSGHPDFIKVAPSGKNGMYLLDSDLRPVISQAYIKPNQSKYKVVLIADVDSNRPDTQNVLLKLVEEPPEYLVIIMTAKSREAFLKTILSRVTPFILDEVEKNVCYEAVKEIAGQDFTDKAFEKAYGAFGGNIGRCAGFMTDRNLSKACEVTENAVKAIAKRDEYSLLSSLSMIVGERDIMAQTLKLLSNVFRDTTYIRKGAEGVKMLSSCREETAELAKKLSASKSMLLFELCEEYSSRLSGNANMTLLVNAFCAGIMDIV